MVVIMIINKLFVCFALVMFCIIPIFSIQAQESKLPPLPKSLQTYIEQGAQMKYLGRERGFDSWLSIRGGIEEFYHVPANNTSTFFMGIMYDESGKPITLDQIRRLQNNNDALLNGMMGEAPSNNIRKEIIEQKEKTPAQRLYSDVENSNWVVLGNIKAPHIYVFIDPQCPHCHEYLKDLEIYISAGSIQLRIVPVGVVKPESKGQAAYILAAKNGGKLLYDYIKGDSNALMADDTINLQGAERNLSILQSWKFDVTPVTIYKSSNNQIKLIRGRASNINDIINDMK